MPTPFEEEVYSICKRIPPGYVTTYGDIASLLGIQGAQAVGRALNKNPYWPKVPCHRVVGSTGHLVGFARGIERKKELLEQEGVHFKKDRVAQECILRKPSLETRVQGKDH